MIEPLQVHQLMNDHVVAYPVGHGDEPPVQAHVPVAPAGTPSCALIANAKPADDQPVTIGKLAQPDGQLAAGLRAKPLSFLDGEAPLRQHGALAQHPVEMPPREGVGFAARSPARNGHADTSVVLDAKEIPAGPAMANEIDRGDRFDGRRRELHIGHARERKPELHGDRIPDSPGGLDTPAGTSVIFIALVRGI